MKESSENLTMSTNEGFSDIYDFELKLREKLAHLQFKEEALEQCQTKLTESKNLSCQLRILLENERQTLKQVRSELRTAMELIVQLEDEKIHDHTERTRLEIKWQNARINQDNLMDQAKKAKLANILLQRKNEMLEADLLEQKKLNQFITESVKDLRNQMNHLYPTIERNVAKLKGEQKYICHSFQAFAEFNRRIGNGTKIDFNVLESSESPMS